MKAPEDPASLLPPLGTVRTSDCVSQGAACGDGVDRASLRGSCPWLYFSRFPLSLWTGQRHRAPAVGKEMVEPLTRRMKDHLAREPQEPMAVQPQVSSLVLPGFGDAVVDDCARV